MCKKLRYYLCSECEEYEIQLDPCDVDEHITCDFCFERKAIEEKDELSLMIIRHLEEARKQNPSMKFPKHRQVKKSR